MYCAFPSVFAKTNVWFGVFGVKWNTEFVFRYIELIHWERATDINWQ